MSLAKLPPRKPAKAQQTTARRTSSGGRHARDGKKDDSPLGGGESKQTPCFLQEAEGSPSGRPLRAELSLTLRAHRRNSSQRAKHRRTGQSSYTDPLRPLWQSDRARFRETRGGRGVHQSSGYVSPEVKESHRHGARTLEGSRGGSSRFTRGPDPPARSRKKDGKCSPRCRLQEPRGGSRRHPCAADHTTPRLDHPHHS